MWIAAIVWILVGVLSVWYMIFGTPPDITITLIMFGVVAIAVLLFNT